MTSATETHDRTPLRALVLGCTLNPSPTSSSSELLGRQVLEALAEHGVTGDVVRVVDHDVRPGVQVDMGDGDAWPAIREQVMACDVLVVATPIWLGHPLQRRPAGARAAGRRALRDRRRGPPLDRREGRRGGGRGQRGRRPPRRLPGDAGPRRRRLHHPGGRLDVLGGPGDGGTDYQDLDEVPEMVASTTKELAANAAHLARLLKDSPYPPSS